MVRNEACLPAITGVEACFNIGVAIKVPEEDKTMFERLGQTRSTLKTSMSLTESGLDDNVARFSKDLAEAVPKCVCTGLTEKKSPRDFSSSWEDSFSTLKQY